MNEPTPPTRRTLLKGGAATLAAPAVVTVAQADTATPHKESATFNLWVMLVQCLVASSRAVRKTAGIPWTPPSRRESTRSLLLSRP